jgi:broad specificity phosphatase PhoE
MLVYVIRHAQSLANAQATTGLNSDLSPLGVAQSEALGRRFSGVRVSAIYSSPFRRCLQTAEAVARGKRLSIFLRPELWEYHHLEPGAITDVGLATHEEICAAHAGVEVCPDFDSALNWPWADETLELMIARVRRFAAFLKWRWTGDDETIVVVGHGSPIARFIETWLMDVPGPSFRFVIENAAVSALRYRNGVSSLVCLNEMSHMQGMETSIQSNFNADGSLRHAPLQQPW